MLNSHITILNTKKTPYLDHLKREHLSALGTCNVTPVNFSSAIEKTASFSPEPSPKFSYNLISSFIIITTSIVSSVCKFLCIVFHYCNNYLVSRTITILHFPLIIAITKLLLESSYLSKTQNILITKEPVHPVTSLTLKINKI